MAASGLHASRETLDVLARQALEDVAVRERVVAEQILAARVDAGVAKSCAEEARAHHRLIEHAIEVVVRLGEALIDLREAA